MAAEKLFVDTNILTSTLSDDSSRQEISAAVVDEFMASGGRVWISTQILREFLTSMSRPQGGVAAHPVAGLLGYTAGFCQKFDVAAEGMNTHLALRKLLTDFKVAGAQIHDANIVATMQVHGIKRLLTWNTDDFKRFKSLIQVENPSLS